MDGAVFFKEYFKANYETLIGTKRLVESYIPELCEMCNDEEIYIRIEAFEALSYVLETIDSELIEREIIPPLLEMLNQEHEEVVLKMSMIIGQLLFKLKAKQLDVKYKEELMEFFKFICGHKLEKIRLNAAYNLPCFNKIYRHFYMQTP